MLTQYNTDESDTDDDVTSQNNSQVKQPIPPLMDDEDSEDDMDEEPIDMERMMDDLTINDIGEREKIPEKKIKMNKSFRIITRKTLKACGRTGARTRTLTYLA